VFVRLWHLLEPTERRRVLGIAPLLLLSALVEIVGVAAVIPFLAVLTDPASLASLPLIATLLPEGAADAGTTLKWAGFALAAILVVANTLVILTNWWLYRFSWGLNHSISSRLLRHYLAQPYAFLLIRNSAALANRIVVEVRQLVDQGVRAGLEVLTRSVVIVALVAFLVALNPLTALVAFLALGGVYSAVFLATRRYLRRIGRESVRTGAARLKAVNEALGGFKDLRVAGREASAFEQYLLPSRRYGEVQAAVLAISGLPRYALEAVAVGGLVVVATLLSGRQDGAVGTLPLLGAYAFAGLRLLPAMQVLFSAFARMRFASGALDAVEGDLREVQAETPLLAANEPALPFRKDIELRGITFAYPSGDGVALEDVTLRVPRHRSLAILGRTGSGKSTLVDVLLGLLEPQRGVLAVDGMEVTAEDLRSYRRLFGYVSQSIFLLDDTIARNVAFGLRDDAIDMEAVRRACHQAQIDEFIENDLPHGYRTEVGERGVRLSGGQRQRIGIARALYHQPEILVFDEATSALDVHTEHKVYAALEIIAKDRTVVTIAHRLETVAKADHVVVLEQGRVVDQGAPGEVLARYRSETVLS
jgi:ATP-binding cassette, subfamily B, bacterial PglK